MPKVLNPFWVIGHDRSAFLSKPTSKYNIVIYKL
jgi:hypothetical protein